MRLFTSSTSSSKRTNRGGKRSRISQSSTGYANLLQITASSCSHAPVASARRSASFSSLPPEVVREILSILLQVQPKELPRVYVVDKRYWRIASSLKSTTFLPPPYGRDNLAQLLRHPRFNHADWTSPIRDFTLSIDSSSAGALPYQIPILSRLANITSFSLYLRGSTRVPASLIEALQGLPHLRRLALLHNTTQGDSYMPPFQLKRDLPRIEGFSYFGGYFSRVFDGAPSLKTLDILVPVTLDGSRVARVYNALPWTSLTHLTLRTAPGSPFPQPESYFKSLQAAVLEDEELDDPPPLPLRSLRLCTTTPFDDPNTFRPIALRDGSSPFLSPTQYDTLLSLLSRTSLFHLDLPFRGPIQLPQGDYVVGIRSLVLRATGYLDTPTHTSLLQLLTIFPRLDKLVIIGLIPFEKDHGGAWEQISHPAAAIVLPHLTAIISFLKKMTAVRELAWQTDDLPVDRISFRWTRFSPEDDFRVNEEWNELGGSW